MDIDLIFSGKSFNFWVQSHNAAHMMSCRTTNEIDISNLCKIEFFFLYLKFVSTIPSHTAVINDITFFHKDWKAKLRGVT